MVVVNVESMGELRRIVAALDQRQAELAAAGVGFSARASRRRTIHGTRHRLLLHVVPEAGFDDFAWDAFFSPWTGSAQRVLDVERAANRVLDAYAAGDVPPGPGFA